MFKISRFLTLSLFVILSVAFLSGSVFAQGKIQDEQLKKGIYLFRQENYDEALETFKQAVKKDPGSSLAAYYLGLTYKRMEDYVDAKKYLEASLEMKPKIKGALIELIDLLYRLDEFEEAKKWIKVAEDEGVRPAQAKFLKGLTLQKSGEYEGSIKAFEEAKTLDDQLSQSANYQIGVCYIRMERFGEAKNIFQETLIMDPYSDIGRYADKYIDALDRKLEGERPFHLRARFAFEYDSNVVLQPTDTEFVTEIADKGDTREVYEIKPDYTFRTKDNSLSLKTGYGLRISKQNRLGKYDMVTNQVLAQPNINFERIMMSFPVAYDHTIVDGKNYIGTFNAGNMNNILLTDSQMVQLGAIYKYDDYMRPNIIPGENRSGNEIVATTSWFWFFAQKKGFAYIRYNFNKDWAKGNNWQYSGNKVGLGFLYPFWDKFKISANGEIFFQNFDKTNTIFARKRKDQVYTWGTFLAYEVVKNLELQVRYNYVKDSSNLSVYDYDRHIVSTGVQYYF